MPLSVEPHCIQTDAWETEKDKLNVIYHAIDGCNVLSEHVMNRVESVLPI